MENLIKGEKDLFEIEVKGLQGSYLTDDGITCKLVFYTKGRRSEGTVTVTELVPAEEGDTNKVYCVVDTSTLPQGELMVEATVDYPNPLVAKELTGMASASTECNITVNN